jgi:hypothetical protein
MIFRILLNFLSGTPKPVALGRWGYHWDASKHVQKYYD